MKKEKPFKLKKSNRLVFSDNGSQLVTLSRDVVGWDVGARAKRFRSHPLSHPAHCAVDSTGAYIAVKNTMGQIVVLDAMDGALAQVLDPYGESEGSNICYSPCGEYLIDASWTGIVTVRSAMTGDVVFRQRFANEMLTYVVHSAAGDKWALLHNPLCVDGQKPEYGPYLSIWDWPLSAPTDILMLPDDRIRSLALSSDGERICSLGSRSVSLFRLSDKKLMASTSVNGVSAGSATTWSPAGEELATVQKHSVVIHHPDTLETKQVITLDYASSVAYSPDGAYLAIGSWGCGLLLERETLVQ